MPRHSSKNDGGADCPSERLRRTVPLKRSETVPTVTPMVSQQLLTRILGRSESLFQAEIESCRDQITDLLAGARLLVIGAAGSIGSAFVHELCRYPLRGLHLVDLNENSLVEVVRDLRAAGVRIPADFRTFSVDFSAPEFTALLCHESYSHVLNFAALKHVRSERDPYTLMRLLRINVVANHNLFQAFPARRRPARIFAVSSDKAVRPASLMGASKAMMERVFLAQADQVPFSSARFANVAFSTGSLLEGFLLRIRKRQPLGAPSDVRRYFISHQEAGQLCLLAAAVGRNREIFIPSLSPDSDLKTFSEIARLVLEAHGYEALECQSDDEARRRAAALGPGDTRWPCVFLPSDTSGEKPFEEFADPAEAVDLHRFSHLGVVTRPIDHGIGPLREAVHRISGLEQSGNWNKEDLVAAVRIAVPELEHVETRRDLDQKL